MNEPLIARDTGGGINANKGKGKKAIKMQVHEDDPALWSNAQLLKWDKIIDRSFVR